MSVLLSLASRAGDFQFSNQQKNCKNMGSLEPTCVKLHDFGLPEASISCSRLLLSIFSAGACIFFFFFVVIPDRICCCSSVLEHLKRLRRQDRMRLFLDLVNAPRWNLVLKLRTLLGTYRVSTFSVDDSYQLIVNYLREGWFFRCV